MWSFRGFLKKNVYMWGILFVFNGFMISDPGDSSYTGERLNHTNQYIQKIPPDLGGKW